MKNVWQNSFTYWIEVVKCLNYLSLYSSFTFSSFFSFLFFFPYLFLSLLLFPPLLLIRLSSSPCCASQPPPAPPPLGVRPRRHLPSSASAAASRRPPAPAPPSLRQCCRLQGPGKGKAVQGKGRSSVEPRGAMWLHLCREGLHPRVCSTLFGRASCGAEAGGPFGALSNKTLK